MGILVIMMDLQCGRCKKKIDDVLKCLQGKTKEMDYCIEKIEYDDKANKVIVRGKFDREKLRQKIWCKACKVVEEIIVIDVWPPQPPKKCPSKSKQCTPEPEPPKPTCKFLPYPYPMTYPIQCYWNCPPQQCLCCLAPKPPPSPPPPPQEPKPCECSPSQSHHPGGCSSGSKPALPPPCNCSKHRGCSCGKQSNWPPPTCPPFFPPPWWTEESPPDPCSIM